MPALVLSEAHQKTGVTEQRAAREFPMHLEDVLLAVAQLEAALGCNNLGN